jgi:hypothetical protein
LVLVTCFGPYTKKDSRHNVMTCLHMYGTSIFFLLYRTSEIGI